MILSASTATGIIALCSIFLLGNVSAAKYKTISLPNFTFSDYPSKADIGASYVNNELINKAYNEIKKTVDPNILAIPVNRHDPDSYCSVIKSDEDIELSADACYWQDDLCVRNTETVNFGKDFTHCVDGGVWSMTFDDGPNDGSLSSGHGTEDILANLDAVGKKATFFLIGSNIINTPGGKDIVKEIIEKGHDIGAHTWSHSPMTVLTNKQIIAEFLYTESAIAEATGNKLRPSIWRPPCGDIDDRVRAIASALGYTTIMWTSYPDRDSRDSLHGWKASDKTINKLVYDMSSWFEQDKKAGFISLQHDVSPTSLSTAAKFFEVMKSSQSTNTINNVVPLSECDPQISPLYIIRGVLEGDDDDVHVHGEETEESDDDDVHAADAEVYDDDSSDGPPKVGSRKLPFNSSLHNLSVNLKVPETRDLQLS